MRCIGGNAETSEAWHCNYNAIATDGLAVENVNGRRISRVVIAFIWQTRQSRPFPESYSIRRISKGSTPEGRSEKVRWLKFCSRSPRLYAAENSIPASTEANLSRPDKGRTRAREVWRNCMNTKLFPGYWRIRCYEITPHRVYSHNACSLFPLV